MASLQEYRKKRHFESTPEPSPGAQTRRQGHSFVVQKHDATRLHYDFRLEIDGVLKSWAVPKGPSLNPADKRLAVETEDHPLDYGGFEGVIPEGNYGAGEVMLWDRGAYQTEGALSASQQYQRGEIKFTLRGEKLRGSFVLVKLRGSRSKGRDWLLIKHRDAAADGKWNIEEHDGSVSTGRSLADIAEDRPASRSDAVNVRSGPESLEGASKATMPAQVRPALAVLASKPFSDRDWLFEIKWDGERVLAWVRDGQVELRSRTGRAMTSEYPELHILPRRLDARNAVLDGEIVVLDAQGRSDFQRLQGRFSVRHPSAALLRDAPVVMYVFDLLYCDGYDLRAVPLIQRKKLLQQILSPCHVIRYSDHIDEKGEELFALARKQGLEGILGKQTQSPYPGRRSPVWLKFKLTQELDAVIGGWTDPRGSREHFGALLLGLYDQAGKLQYIGSVGTGFTRESGEELFAKLKQIQAQKSPFAALPRTREQSYWTEPVLVARVSYSEWTGEKNLRQPSFAGLRDDMEPKECTFEKETSPPLTHTAATSAANAASAASLPATRLGGRALSDRKAIEKELASGRQENINIEIAGKRLRLTNLNKVFFPGQGYSKRDLLHYYYQIADFILPFLKDRPLVLRRCPNGIEGQAFFQKDAGEAAPEWIQTVAVSSEGRRQAKEGGRPDAHKREIQYLRANDLAALLYLTNLGCIDHNPWSSRADDLEHPDYLFFDLDPTEETRFSLVAKVAQALCAKLRELRLAAFVKSSGGRGIHIFLPIERHYSFEQVRSFVEIVARLLASEHPDWLTQEITVRKRPKNRIHLDADQNAFGQSLASVYSLRAFPNAPVSAPLRPEELSAAWRPHKWNIKTILPRLRQEGDLWADFWKRRQRLEPAIELLSDQVERLSEQGRASRARKK